MEGLPGVLSLLSSASLQGRDLAGGFGSLAARGETKRAAISAKRSGLCGWWPPSPAGPCFKTSAGFVLGLRRKGSYSSDSHQPSCVPLEMEVLSSLMVFREVFASARRSGLVSWCWDGFGVVCGDAEQRVSKAWYPAAGWLLSPALP